MLEQRTLLEKAVEKPKVQNPERFVQIDNKLLQFGLAHLSSPAIKVLYFVIARYRNSKKGTGHLAEIAIPLGELRQLADGLDDKNSQRIFQELMAKFHAAGGIEKHGGKLTWFDSIAQGGGNVRFRFNPLVLERILNPQSYTLFYRPEIDRLKSSYAIKIFQVLRGIQNRQADWHSKNKRKFSATQLKHILGIPQHLKLDKSTVQSIIREINRYTFLRVLDVVYRSKSGALEAVEFVFKVKGKSSGSADSGGNSGGVSGGHSPDKETNNGMESTPETLDKLTWTQQAALNRLVSFGVPKKMALGEILPAISKGETVGFEDVFTDKLLSHFKANARTVDADTFVEWWSDGEVFHPSGRVWQSILNEVADLKNELRENAPLDFQKRVGKAEPEISLKKKSVTLNPSPTLKPMAF